MRSRPTVLKRERERAEAEKQKQKQARRQERSARSKDSPRGSGGYDPDLEGITAGPQPPAEWQIDPDEKTTEE